MVTDIVGEQALRDSYRKHAAVAQLLRATPPLALGEWAAEVAGERVTVVAQTSNRGRVTAEFVARETVLPTLERLTCEQHPSTAGLSASNRVRALVHYFMALVEHPARNAIPFLELLAPIYSLHYPAEPVTSEESLRAWVAGPLSSVVASEHVIHSIASDHDGDRWSARVDMKSQALFPDGTGAISRNTQAWRGVDDPTERFPRIETILIDRDALIFFDATGQRTR